MSLIEKIEGLKFSEEDLRFYLNLVSLEAFCRQEVSTLILIAAARHINALQGESAASPPEAILGDFVDLVRHIRPPKAPKRPRPKLTVISGAEARPSSLSTPTGADNAQ